MVKSRARAELFVEDEAHRAFVVALLNRLAEETGTAVDVSVISARGGHGRVSRELGLYKRAVEVRGGSPDLVVVAIDANCREHREVLSELRGIIRQELFPRRAFAVPDPHVERWYMADPASLAHHLGIHITWERRKCERALYKKMLIDALKCAGYIVSLGGAEYAEDFVRVMNLYQAGKNEPSLGSFVDELRNCLKSITP